MDKLLIGLFIIAIGMILIIYKKKVALQEDVVYETEEINATELEAISKWRTHLVNRLAQYISNLYGIDENEVQNHFSMYEPKVDRALLFFINDIVEIEMFFNWEDGIFEAQFTGYADNVFKKKKLKLKLTDAGVDDIKFLKFLVKTYNYYYEDDE